MITQCTTCGAYIHRVNKQFCCGIDYLVLHNAAEPMAAYIGEIPPVQPATKKIERQRRKSNSITKKVRLDILERDHHQCTLCPATDHLEVHHVVYRENGGTHDPSNLITVCDQCHANIHIEEPVYRIMMQRVEQRLLM